jgi:hypothetical protein
MLQSNITPIKGTITLPTCMPRGFQLATFASSSAQGQPAGMCNPVHTDVFPVSLTSTLCEASTVLQIRASCKALCCRLTASTMELSATWICSTPRLSVDHSNNKAYQQGLFEGTTEDVQEKAIFND